MTLLLLMSAMVGLARAEPQVRILLHENLTQVTVRVDGVTRIFSQRDHLPQEIGPGIGPVIVQGRPYRGRVEICREPRTGRGVDRRRLRVINHVGLDDYVKGVVPSEMPGHWSLEALKAQAVAARTYALYRMSRAPNEGMVGILRPSVLDQVYRGMRAETAPTNAAVDATRGEALTVDGEWLVAYFHACCGDMSERPASVWGMTGERTRDRAWMAANEHVFGERSDPWCAASPWTSWHSTVSRRRVASALRRLTGMTVVDRLTVLTRTASGRAARFSVDGRMGRRHLHRELNAQTVRMAIGPNVLRSLLVDVEMAQASVVFRGRGWGHGVGLCQWGARGRAEAGQDYRAILAAYYPGADLVRVADGRVAD